MGFKNYISYSAEHPAYLVGINKFLKYQPYLEQY